MEIVKTHLIFLNKRNGPEFYRAFCKVVETKEGYFFEENNGGYFQIGQKEYEGSLKWTLGNMPNLDVQYSQPRERRD